MLIKLSRHHIAEVFVQRSCWRSSKVITSCFPFLYRQNQLPVYFVFSSFPREVSFERKLALSTGYYWIIWFSCQNWLQQGNTAVGWNLCILGMFGWRPGNLPVPGSASRQSISSAWGQDRCLVQGRIQTSPLCNIEACCCWYESRFSTVCCFFQVPRFIYASTFFP